MDDQVGGDGVRVHDARQRHPAVGELFDDLDVSEEVEPRPPYSSGMVIPKKAERLHLLDDCVRTRACMLHLRRDGNDLACDEATHGRDQLPANLGIGGCGSGHARNRTDWEPGQFHRRYRTQQMMDHRTLIGFRQDEQLRQRRLNRRCCDGC